MRTLKHHIFISMVNFFLYLRFSATFNFIFYSLHGKGLYQKLRRSFANNTCRTYEPDKASRNTLNR